MITENIIGCKIFCSAFYTGHICEQITEKGKCHVQITKQVACIRRVASHPPRYRYRGYSYLFATGSFTPFIWRVCVFSCEPRHPRNHRALRDCGGAKLGKDGPRDGSLGGSLVARQSDVTWPRATRVNDAAPAHCAMQRLERLAAPLAEPFGLVNLVSVRLAHKSNVSRWAGYGRRVLSPRFPPDSTLPTMTACIRPSRT